MAPRRGTRPGFRSRAEIAAGSVHGITLVSNKGGIIRSLPVPGVKYGCGAVRWWDSGCSPAVSVVWFSPATRALTVALPVHGHQDGVVGAVPYFVAGKY
jgi:hypothetical protein